MVRQVNVKWWRSPSTMLTVGALLRQWQWHVLVNDHANCFCWLQLCLWTMGCLWTVPSCLWWHKGSLWLDFSISTVHPKILLVIRKKNRTNRHLFNMLYFVYSVLMICMIYCWFTSTISIRVCAHADTMIGILYRRWKKVLWLKNWKS